VALAAEITGAPRNALYAQALARRHGEGGKDSEDGKDGEPR